MRRSVLDLQFVAPGVAYLGTRRSGGVWATIVLLACFGLSGTARVNGQDSAAEPQKTQPSQQVAVEQIGDVFRVTVGGELFTEVHVRGYRRPICYPILGPGQTPMTRNHPMKPGVAGEATDHPHHKSMWFAHGAVNGVSFWDEKGEVRVAGWSRVTPDSLTFQGEWYSPAGELVCRDQTTLGFGAAEGRRWIDWDVRLQSLGVPLVFGDTKEGMMAVRTHPNLNLTNPAGPDGRVVVGRARNSEGVSGKAIWGQRARWVDYVGEIDGRTVGMAVLDSPDNLRHPTYWHARDYGLVAANPFGQHDFTGSGQGDHTLAAHSELRFRYRFIFHSGEASNADVDGWWAAFAAGR